MGRLAALVVLFALLPNAAAFARTISVTVERGSERYVDFPKSVKRLSVGDSKIADVSLIDDKTLRILGIAPGKTTFSLWEESLSEPVIYEVTVSSNLGALESALTRDPNLRGAHVNLAGGKLVLTGHFPDAGSQKKARDLAAYMTGAEILDQSDLASDNIVQIEVQFAAIAKTTLDDLGLNFNALGKDFSIASTAPTTLQSFNLNTGGSSGINSSTGTSAGIGAALSSVSPIASAFNVLLGSPKYNALAVISALKSNNLAQTLAEPTLVVRSGEKADFLVGGEIPIPVPQGNNSNAVTIEYKKFGVGLKIEPTILKDHRIALKIAPEVSELDFSNAISIQGFTIPAIRTRETQTTIETGENEPLILAGLMFASANTVEERVPYLSNIPVLGEFFKRTSKTHETQELIVTVTPRLINSGSQDKTLQNRVRRDLSKISLVPATEQER